MSRLSAGRAVGLWIAYVIIFAIAGGLAAGVLALLYAAVVEPFSNTLYAIVFGATGYMAYRLARGVMEEGQ